MFYRTDQKHGLPHNPFNALVARWGRRVARPFHAYAGLELLVGAVGVGLVLAFPLVGQALAPLMGALGGVALNALRVAVSFVLLLVPSTAMGATLPLLAGALSARDSNFGRVLGRFWKPTGYARDPADAEEIQRLLTLVAAELDGVRPVLTVSLGREVFAS